MADYKNIAWLIHLIQKKESWKLGAGENPCTDFDYNENPLFGKNRNNISKGISYTYFQTNAKNFLYSDNCETFKKMPYDVWNLIFKGFYWNSIEGDNIKNQGIANILVYEKFKYGTSFYKTKLKNLGFESTPIDYSGLSFSERIGLSLKNSFNITQEELDFINSEIEKGNSSKLFKELTTDIQKKNIIYFVSKLYCLNSYEKLLIYGILTVVSIYVTYKLIK